MIKQSVPPLPTELVLLALEIWISQHGNNNHSNKAIDELAGALSAVKRVATEKLRSASLPGCRFFEELDELLARLPQSLHPRMQIDLYKDCAKSFYVSSPTFDGMRPLKRAETIAQVLGDLTQLGQLLTTRAAFCGDARNYGEALQLHSRALSISVASGNRYVQAQCWLNAGTTIYYMADYQTAVACWRRAIEITQERECQPPPGHFNHIVRNAAFSNIAMCAFHTNDIQHGLQAVDDALRDNPEPETAHQFMSRVLLSRNASRLYLAAGDAARAKEHADMAVAYAATSKSSRAQMEAAIAAGMYDAYLGDGDSGVARLLELKSKAARNASELPEILLALVKSHEKRGEPEQALIHLREMMEIRVADTQARVLRHLTIDLPVASDVVQDSAAALAEMDFSLREQKERLVTAGARYDSLLNVALVAELRDDSTGQNIYRVGKLSALLAAESGFAKQASEKIELAARLHDIGKYILPDAIVEKPGAFNVSEQFAMQCHAAAGAKLLAMADRVHLSLAVDIARSHHERWDGTGYPDGLSQDRIPIAARIVALAEAFDAMTHRRPHKEAFPIERALEEILNLGGTQFDPQLAVSFVALIRKLVREHADLDGFLALDANTSLFLRARIAVDELLRAPSTSAH